MEAAEILFWILLGIGVIVGGWAMIAEIKSFSTAESYRKAKQEKRFPLNIQGTFVVCWSLVGGIVILLLFLPVNGQLLDRPLAYVLSITLVGCTAGMTFGELFTKKTKTYTEEEDPLGIL